MTILERSLKYNAGCWITLLASGLAGPGEVLVSGVMPPLVLGSGIAFEDRGRHELKGVPDSWPVFAVDASRG